jgi:hypothetical protein
VEDPKDYDWSDEENPSLPVHKEKQLESKQLDAISEIKCCLCGSRDHNAWDCSVHKAVTTDINFA